jgi:arylsulfatase A-like enzyme
MPRLLRRLRALVAAVLLCTHPAAHAQVAARSPDAEAPALVVLVAVDQFRPDYFARFGPQLAGGLGRLYREGVVYLHALQDHAITQTAPGHATMLSGRVPARTGILTNARGVPDPLSPVLHAPGAEPASPRRFRGTTLYDWMLARDPDARVLSVSRKNRGAILPVGRAAGEVYWYAGGGFTTSRWYRDSLPGWVRDFNARGGVERLAGRPWEPLLDASAYPEPDSAPWENGGRRSVFPHRLPTALDSLRRHVVDYPWMDSLTLDFALEGVRRTGIGRRARPDLLVVSLSTTDAVGHTFGPDSRELHDQVLRTDRWLGWFLDSLATLVPRRRTVVALTSDHGTQPVPGHERAVRGRDVWPLWLGDLERETAAALRARWNTDFAVDFDYGLLLADVAALRARGVDVDSLARALAARAARERGVLRVYTPASLAAAPASDTLAGRWRRSIPEGQGWLVAAVPRPGHPWTTGTGANHGAPWDADALVPIVVAAPGVPHRIVRRPVRVVDLAPTLAALVGVRPTERVDGVVLEEVAPAGAGRRRGSR